LSYVKGGTLSTARLEPPRSPKPLATGSQDSCCSRSQPSIVKKIHNRGENGYILATLALRLDEEGRNSLVR